MDNQYAQKKIVDGQVLIPRQYGVGYDKTGPMKAPLQEGYMWDPEFEEGKEPKWYHFVPETYWEPRNIEIYLWSMDRKDLNRIRTDEGWIGFLEGNDPDYPERELRKQLTIIRDKMEDLRNDPTTPDTRLADWPSQYNPLQPMLELNRQIQGGYIAAKMYVLHSRVRYFDPARYRAGLPEEVASLVTGVHENWTKVKLVNLDPVKARDVVVQTGGYGEHQCSHVESGDTILSVNDNHFTVHLEPGTGSELTIYHDRYANQPSLKFPWRN